MRYVQIGSLRLTVWARLGRIRQAECMGEESLVVVVLDGFHNSEKHIDGRTGRSYIDTRKKIGSIALTTI